MSTAEDRAAWEKQAAEWEANAVEAFAAAWFRAAGFSEGYVNPRFEFTDAAIQDAWRGAARRYVSTGELRAPVLKVVRDKWVEVTPK